MSTWSKQCALLGIPELPAAAFSHVGDRKIRLYGGGGSSAPEGPAVTQQIQQSDPSMYGSSTSSTSTRSIPQWLEGASQDIVNRSGELSRQGYQSYEGPRVAEFSPMMNQAFDRIGGQQVSGQLGTATDFATQAGNTALEGADYNPYEMGGFTAETAQQYMNPFTQNVTDIELRELQRRADIEKQTRSAAAVKSGAFGGGRQAIMDSEANRNLMQQQGDVQSTGLQRAFEAARSQYTTEDQMREQSRQFGADLGQRGANTSLQAAQVLGGLGQQQFGQEMDITRGLGLAGEAQGQREQALLDVDYQDFLAAQRDPFERLAFHQSMVAGVPHSVTTTGSSHTSGYTAPGETRSVSVNDDPQAMDDFRASDFIAKGGLVGLAHAKKRKKGAKPAAKKGAGLSALAMKKMNA